MLYASLNRTFYGIEIDEETLLTAHNVVLIVPFMELKCGRRGRCLRGTSCLNRTFYGIEIAALLHTWVHIAVS